MQAVETLQPPSRALLGALTALFSPKFLLSKDTRPRVLQWIATALQCDKERTKMQVTDSKATSDGFMVNLNRVLLHLCGPFTDFYSGKAKQFINVECVDPCLRSRSCFGCSTSILHLLHRHIVYFM